MTKPILKNFPQVLDDNDADTWDDIGYFVELLENEGYDDNDEV